uniref:Cytochrome P450 n=1 Tax=Kalanchoe fedtschenkoi TaxID=63787 RepID=A0A7N0T754_KALFE
MGQSDLITQLGFSLIALLLPVLWIYRFRRLSGQGPATYPIIGCFISFYRNRRRLLTWYTELLSRSQTQTIVVDRLGATRTVVTANPENVEYILKTNFNNFPKGKPFTDILGDFLGRGIFNVDGAQWHAQRKMASHEFTVAALRGYANGILKEEVEERLLPVMEKMVGRVVDLQELLRRLAFDLVCRETLGFDPCLLDPDSDPLPVSDFGRAFDAVSMICAMRGAAAVPAVWKVKRALGVGSERELKRMLRKIHDPVNELIRVKKKLLSDETGDSLGGKDLVSRLISAGHNDDEAIRDAAISFVMAGRDTTSAAMTWLFWLLSRNPDVESRILAEVSATFDSNSTHGDLFDKLKEMRVLKACLCETMRLYPPVAWDSKHALADDTLPDGTAVGRGDRVTYFPYGMGRMEALWGEDWAEFKPDRWLVGPGAKDPLNRVSPYKYPVFQAGPRVCLGKEMAFVQMKYVVGSILRRFELSGVGEGEKVFVPMLTAHMAGGLNVLIQRRQVEKE